MIPAVTRRPWVLHAPALAINLIVLLLAGRNQWFFFDEWDPIANQTGWRGLFRPHGEHPIIIPRLIYRVLLDMVGMRSYLPYLLVLIVLQLVLTHLLWRLMIGSGVRPVVATAVAFVFGMLGVGYENLLWAFQMSLIGSAVCGMAALLLSAHDGPMRRRDWAAVAFATVSWMFSGLGLTVILMVAGAAAIRRRWSATVVLAVVPLVLYELWALRFAGTAMTGGQSVLESVRGASLYAVTGFTWAFGQIVGSGTAGPVLVVLVAIGVVMSLGPRVGRRAPAVAGFAGGLLFLFLAGIRRGSLGVDQSQASRYVYVVLSFSAIAIAVAVDRMLRRRPSLAPAALVVLALVLGVQINVLSVQSTAWAARSASVRGSVLAAADRIRSGGVVIDDNQVDPVWAPDLDAGELRRLVDKGWLPDSTPGVGTDLEVTNRLQLGVLPVNQGLVPHGGVALLGTNGSQPTPPVGGCVRVTPSAPSSTIALGSNSPGSVELRSSSGRTVSVQAAGSDSLAPISSAKSVELPAGRSDLVMAGKDTIAVITLADVQAIRLCGLEQP